MNRGGFSWKRFVGRQRKIGRMVTGGGCLVLIMIGGSLPVALVLYLVLK
jgi:hypothetical protein